MKKMNEEAIQRIFEYIQMHQMEKGDSPSYRKIMDVCGIKTIGQVQRSIRILKERGKITSSNNGKIALDTRFSSGMVSIPLIGTIACGQPIFAVENYEDVYRFPTELVGSGEHFMLRAKGDSMINAGIFDGDLLIIRKQQEAQRGQIVAALIDDEATVKRFCPEG